MKISIKLFFLSLNILVLFSCKNEEKTVNNSKVVINIQTQGTDTISKHIYGHFSEHLGRCIYNGLYVGEENKIIPNTEGVRNDIIAALKELQIPNLRWPGGCFADTYHWKDGVGPKEERPTIVNRWWGGTTEDNSFGTHNFLNLCEVLGAEPYLSGNVGSGTVQELIDWVQYTNHADKSPMADWRRENGREEPWNVKYWGVGNEAWGCGGNMTAEYYADLYRKYATFMAGWSTNTKIFRIASGATDSDYHWTETLMKNVPHELMEAVALHDYAVFDWVDKGPSVNFDEDVYFKTMDEALKMEEYVTKHIEIMDKYDPENKIALFVDEWGGWYDAEPSVANGVLFQQNTMRDVMLAGTVLNTFNNHARRVKMANLAQVVNVLQAVILTDEEKMILTPTYHVMNMYKVHQDATLLPSEINNNPEYRKLPTISVSASKDKNENTHISLVNIDATKAHEVIINIDNIKDISASILASEKIQDHNTFENPDKVKPENFTDFKVEDGKIIVTIPAFSLIVFEGK
ncbi:alpha-N-arabinofuranosidase [Flaviramulus basaltis]|uniref:non-reducing end alpha-L-arabinofuranosidase n=1 Tax=Flaviramulus basaltis TaxID=369401 RepID=A0A1K2IID8_9FLAO|nr:alpha-L-arabinofuranosidase C-terminal domain-containing protein [Flaviramulus basaltis]SFZ92000.1 alpha-N-arabinofuranosidase [Flaviramulus basaltis]